MFYQSFSRVHLRDVRFETDSSRTIFDFVPPERFLSFRFMGTASSDPISSDPRNQTRQAGELF